MPKNPPVVYILHGEDDQAMAEFLHAIRAKMGDPSTADMNTTRLEAKGLSFPALRSACLSAPFLAKRRLVIVEGYLSALSARGSKKTDAVVEEEAVLESDSSASVLKKELLEFMEGLPVSTALVLSEHRQLPQSNFAIKWAAAHADLTFIREFAPPKGAALAPWIQKRAAQEGGEFSPRAAQMLAALVGEDPRTLSQEVIKLITYANGRPVSAEDVTALTPESTQTNIFEMVDSIGGRDAKSALCLLRKTLEQGSAPAIFGMVVRQFRLLLLAREAMDAGVTAGSLASAIGVHPYVAQKLAAQARGFTLASLEAIFRRLRDIDLDVKTGRVELDTALEGLAFELTI